MTDAADRPLAEAVLPDLAATARLAERLALALAPGDVIALVGDLGAGKTELARAIVRALTGDPDAEVPSPTFTLVQTYDLLEATVWHFDLYRLELADEVWELGLEEALAAGASLIEWPERAGGLLPRERLVLHFSHAGEGRRVTLFPHGAWTGRIRELAA